MVTTALRQRTDVTPNRDDIEDLFKQGDLVPVYRRLLADLETPVSVFMKLTQNHDAYFMLESVEGGEQVGRYSFIGVNPKAIITIKFMSAFSLISRVLIRSSKRQTVIKAIKEIKRGTRLVAASKMESKRPKIMTPVFHQDKLCTSFTCERI